MLILYRGPRVSSYYHLPLGESQNKEINKYHHDDQNIRLFLDEILRIKNFYYVPPTFEFAVFFLFFVFFSVVDIPSHTVVKIKLKKLISRRNLTMIQCSRLSIILWPTNSLRCSHSSNVMMDCIISIPTTLCKYQHT